MQPEWKISNVLPLCLHWYRLLSLSLPDGPWLQAPRRVMEFHYQKRGPHAGTAVYIYKYMFATFFKPKTAGYEKNISKAWNKCPNLSLVNPSTILIHTPFWSGTRWRSIDRFVSSIFKQQGNNSMGWDIVNSHVTNDSAVVGVGP
jgi:hypothetical protein